jgi:hypothetical protein
VQFLQPTFTLDHTAAEIRQKSEFLLEFFGFGFLLFLVIGIRGIAGFQLGKGKTLQSNHIQTLRPALPVETD